MATVRNKPNRSGNYQALYLDHNGRRRTVTMPTKSKALKVAKLKEAQSEEIRLGVRPAPSSASEHCNDEYANVIEEYLAWGCSQGGRRGRPWSEKHGKHRRKQLAWWEEQLGLHTLGDLKGVLPRVEKALRGLLKAGRAGKTIANYAESLGAFCDWCIQRGYMDTDPLKGLAPFDTTPQTVRRAMLVEEIRQLLEVAPSHRRMLYEVAFLSGLRANELRNLTVVHLDVERSGLNLDAAWTKNRKPGFQPLPKDLIERLRIFASSGEARSIYEKNFKKAKSNRLPPENPLLYVPTQTDRVLKIDLQAAGIPIQNVKGKLDFHACRVAFINLILERGEVTPKEAQDLARHSTLDMTMNTYGRVREERLAEAVERAGKAILQPKCVPAVYRLVAGAERENATRVKSAGCVSQKLVAGAGFEPATFGL